MRSQHALELADALEPVRKPVGVVVTHHPR